MMVAVALGLVGHQSAGGEQVHFASLVFHFIFPSLKKTNKLSLFQHMSFLPFALLILFLIG